MVPCYPGLGAAKHQGFAVFDSWYDVSVNYATGTVSGVMSFSKEIIFPIVSVIVE